jgi:hypothetical protein
MPIERRRDGDGEAGIRLRDGVDEARKVALQMHPEGKEIRYDQNAVDAFRQKCGDSAIERGSAQFEKGSLDVREIAGAGKVGSDSAYGLVGGFNAGTVGEDDDAGSHGGTCDHCSVGFDGTELSSWK